MKCRRTLDEHLQNIIRACRERKSLTSSFFGSIIHIDENNKHIEVMIDLTLPKSDISENIFYKKIDYNLEMLYIQKLV